MSDPAPNSSQEYAQVPRMRDPNDPIPPPSEAAAYSAVQAYQKVLESFPQLVKEFEAKFSAWKETWTRPSIFNSLAQARCDVQEFDELMDMGPEIRPLVVYKLLDRSNFTAVFLYNALEDDKKYLIDPNDVVNFLTLQRQNNLIIDINEGREW